MSQIPAGSSIRLTDLNIDVESPSGLSLTQSIDAVNYGVATTNTCGFGVRPGPYYVCKLASGGVFLPPTKRVETWLDNYIIH
jgi:hypothetical protein